MNPNEAEDTDACGPCWSCFIARHNECETGGCSVREFGMNTSPDPDTSGAKMKELLDRAVDLSLSEATAIQASFMKPSSPEHAAKVRARREEKKNQTRSASGWEPDCIDCVHETPHSTHSQGYGEEELTYGQIAYEAYSALLKLQPWSALDPRIQEAWEASARAVSQEVAQGLVGILTGHSEDGQ